MSLTGFVSRKRQYIHRIGSKWQHKKYLPVKPATPRSSPEKRAPASGLPGPAQGVSDVFPNTEYVYVCSLEPLGNPCMLIHLPQYSSMGIGSILPYDGTEMEATPVLTQSSKEKITELSVNLTELHPSSV